MVAINFRDHKQIFQDHYRLSVFTRTMILLTFFAFVSFEGNILITMYTELSMLKLPVIMKPKPSNVKPSYSNVTKVMRDIFPFSTRSPSFICNESS